MFVRCCAVALFIGILACNQPRNILTRNMPALVQKMSDTAQQYQKQGWDFIASGTREANWLLQFNYDDSLSFHTTDGIRFTVRTPAPIESENATEFDILTNGVRWKIVLGMTACGPDGNVRIQSTEHLFTGCGNYIYNNSLHGTWSLSAIGKTAVENTTHSLGNPLLQIDLNNRRVKGHDGCNYFQAVLAAEGKRITIGETTFNNPNKNCKSNLTQYINMLSKKTNKYEIAGNNLEITLSNDLVLYFKKVFGY